MRKTDKKIENKLRLSLMDVCETALKEIDGFKWLTHIVNYSNFPQSLKVVCVFDSNCQLSTYTTSSCNTVLESLIKTKLNEIGVQLKNVASHIVYDTEENCTKVHQGNWARRLA